MNKPEKRRERGTSIAIAVGEREDTSLQPRLAAIPARPVYLNISSGTVTDN